MCPSLPPSSQAPAANPKIPGAEFPSPSPWQQSSQLSTPVAQKLVLLLCWGSGSSCSRNTGVHGQTGLGNSTTGSCAGCSSAGKPQPARSGHLRPDPSSAHPTWDPKCCALLAAWLLWWALLQPRAGPTEMGPFPLTRGISILLPLCTPMLGSTSAVCHRLLVPTTARLCAGVTGTALPTQRPELRWVLHPRGREGEERGVGELRASQGADRAPRHGLQLPAEPAEPPRHPLFPAQQRGLQRGNPFVFHPLGVSLCKRAEIPLAGGPVRSDPIPPGGSSFLLPPSSLLPPPPPSAGAEAAGRALSPRVTAAAGRCRERVRRNEPGSERAAQSAERGRSAPGGTAARGGGKEGGYRGLGAAPRRARPGPERRVRRGHARGGGCAASTRSARREPGPERSAGGR